MVVWTAFTSACHSEGSIFGPKSQEKLDTQIRASPVCQAHCRGAHSSTRTRNRVSAPSGPQHSPKLEARIIEFLSEWPVTFLMPAKHVLETRAPHLYFMFLKAYWFRELYLGLKVTASFDRSQSYTRIIDGQVRCITLISSPRICKKHGMCSLSPFLPCMDDSSIYHSLRRESIENASSASTIGVKSVRPTWFEDIAPTNEPTSQTEQDPMHSLKLIVKEEALPLKEQPKFPALAELVSRHWSSRLALRPASNFVSSYNFLVCCNFYNLEASRLALRPSLCASCGLKF